MIGILSFNIDLIVTGIVAAGMLVLGFTAFISDSHSITTKSFLLFTIAGTIWSLFNYAFFHVGNPNIALNIIRIVICVAV